MSTLYIELNDVADADAAVNWWLREGSSISASGTSLLHEIYQKLAALEMTLDKLVTVALIPDCDVLLLAVSIPGRSQARIRQAAPFAVEPHLTEDLGDVHIALGGIEHGKDVSCLVINREKFKQYLARLNEADLEAKYVTTPAMLVNSSNDTLLIEINSLISVRVGDRMVAVMPQALTATLRTAFDDDLQANTIQCMGSDRLVNLTRETVASLEYENVQIKQSSFETFLVDSVEPAKLLNLRQGEFAVKDTRSSLLKVWRRTGAAVAGCAVLIASLLFAHGLWANWQTTQLKKQALDVYESVYNTREIAGNPVFIMQERMGARMEKQSRWLPLLENIVGLTTGVTITSLNFSEAQNQLSITFTTENFQQFEQLQNRFKDQGLKIEVNVAEQQNDLVWARITMSPA